MKGSSKKKPYNEDFSENYHFNVFNEKAFYEKFVKAAHKKRFDTKPVPGNLNTESCVKALKAKIGETIQRETEKALRELYTDIIEDKNKTTSTEEYSSNRKYRYLNLSKGFFYSFFRYLFI